MASPTYRATLTPEVIDTMATLDAGNHITWAGSLRQGEAMVSHTGHIYLEQIAAPTLIIHGELDNVSDAREYAARIPGARLLILPQAGHLVHFEQPDDVYAAVLTFLGVHR